MHTHEPANYFGGRWHPIPGDRLQSRNPAEPAQVVFGCTPGTEHADGAVEAAARSAHWWSSLPRDTRFDVLRAFATVVSARAGQLGDLISREVGKALWESKAEAGLLAGKVEITLDQSQANNSLSRVTGFEFPLTASRSARCVFRPHGVMAVIGPFNFPAHLANGHIVPALAMGNTIIFKPSDKAPAVGQALAQCVVEALRQVLGSDATAPDRGGGVFNLLHGGAEVAQRLVADQRIDAVAFTGSWPVAQQIARASLERPGRMLAFELGGSNPAVVMPDADLALAAIEVARSAFATTGQRCTCTRRLIVHQDVAQKLINAVAAIAGSLIVDHPASSPVFCGPLISKGARADVLAFQDRALAGGAQAVLEARPLERRGGGWYLSPGILRVDRFTPRDPERSDAIDPGCDTEVFGPLLRFTTVTSLDEAVEQANATRFGLAAAIFTQSTQTGESFVQRCRAGCINVNAGTAGASSKLPFGGLGMSGNHRPAGSFALDYCAYPVASMIERGDVPPVPSEGMAFDPAWLR